MKKASCTILTEKSRMSSVRPSILSVLKKTSKHALEKVVNKNVNSN